MLTVESLIKKIDVYANNPENSSTTKIGGHICCGYSMSTSFSQKINQQQKMMKLCYMDTDSFIVCVKTENVYKDIAEDVETKFDTKGNK